MIMDISLAEIRKEKYFASSLWRVDVQRGINATSVMIWDHQESESSADFTTMDFALKRKIVCTCTMNFLVNSIIRLAIVTREMIASFPIDI